VNIRPATKDDLKAINLVVEKAVMTWQMPERVKRLALPSYRYTEQDLEHYDVVVVEQDGRILGVAAWDRDQHDGPENKVGLLIHGIYVHPEHQRRGIGSGLLASAENAARAMKIDGVLLRAQTDAEEFYRSKGLEKLATTDIEQDYARRYWKPID
jgi:GNAT superfamily N-acetyltransferase